MSFGEFVRIEREEAGGARHTVVHFADPKFSVEIAPDAAAPNKTGRGVLKGLCVPNSWAGDYGKYAKLVAAAQDFFEQSFAEPASKTETQRAARRG